MALVALAALVALDVAIGTSIVLTAAYLLPALALAVVAVPRDVAVAAGIAVVLAALSGVWNSYPSAADHLVRVVALAVGGALAVAAAQARSALGAARARAEQESLRMQVLAAVGRLSGAGRVEEALAGIADVLVPTVADLCWAYLTRDDGSPEHVLTRTSGPDGAALEAALGARRSGGPGSRSPTAAVLAGDGSRLVADVDAAFLDAIATDPQDRELLARLGLRSLAVVPLRARGGVIGALGFAVGRSGRRYDSDDLRFFETLAGRAGLVVANAQLVTELGATRAWLDGILGSLAEAVTVHDAQGQTVYANHAAAELMGFAAPDDVLRAKPGQLAKRFRITHEDGSPVRVEEFPGRRLFAGDPDPPPVLTHSVLRETGEEFWLLTKASLLRDESGSGFAVNVIEDVTDAKQAELRQRFLAEAGQVLASSLDYQQTLERVAQLAVPWLADWCAVDMPDGHGGLELVALAHSDPAKVEFGRELRRRFPPDLDAPTGAGAILRGGSAELYHEIPDELLEQSITEPEELAATRALGMRAVMLVPMRIGGETLGLITFVSADSGRTFDDDDFAFAQDLALRAATAVKNALLYEEQARVAHTLQASLLPDHLPDVPGWDSAAAYQAGEQGAEVGGDFYDIVATVEGHVVFLGDVTGKGIDAAALTALVRHSARTAARFDARPAAVLRLVNEVLAEEARVSPVTLVCALIHDEGGGVRVTVASAGHPLPLHKREGGVETIGRSGVLLGVVADGEWPEVEVEVEAGDAMVFYTDGVTDTPGQQDRFGQERLTAVIAAAPAEPAVLLGQLEAALREFQVGTRSDDRAMLVLRHTGELARDAAGGLAGAWTEA